MNLLPQLGRRALPASFEDRGDGETVHLDAHSSQVGVDCERGFRGGVGVVRGYQEVVLGFRAHVGSEEIPRNALESVIKLCHNHVGMDLLCWANVELDIAMMDESAFGRKIGLLLSLLLLLLLLL